MTRVRKVVDISDDPHWADYAELQKPPRPRYAPSTTWDKVFLVVIGPALLLITLIGIVEMFRD